MSHKRTQKQYLSNVLIDGREVLNPLPLINPSSEVTIVQANSPIILLEGRVTDHTMIITDEGTNGGLGNLIIGTFPRTQLRMIEAVCLFEITSAEAGIEEPTSACKVAMGTGPGTTYSLNSAESDISAAEVGTITNGVGVLRSLGGIIGAQIDSHDSTTKWYVNFVVPDADIMYTSSVVCNITARVLLADISDGL